MRRLSGFRGSRRVAAEMSRFTSHASPVAAWERHGGPGRQVSSSETPLPEVKLVTCEPLGDFESFQIVQTVRFEKRL